MMVGGGFDIFRLDIDELRSSDDRVNATAQMVYAASTVGVTMIQIPRVLGEDTPVRIMIRDDGLATPIFSGVWMNPTIKNNIRSDGVTCTYLSHRIVLDE
ncbi:hypothetical protein SISSUDRAFT_1044547 [Sistotremastrum suecicum HHB10207 ss-3]|uniref:Uncharacterized protein n=1 Tax=Sistotremastrum suecicum HHB10207 ss-3 TaxID=1314776 RepID=A0A166F035_9AGAM|nr:hypothetical protein SISSUDRAFT_1044547 [Sistotremastrum suecicum HHB10207 ss-3]